MNKVYMKKTLKRIDSWIDALLPKATTYPAVLHESMRYMIMNGGKRIRPLLAVAACEMCGGKQDDVMYPAVAIECIHTYSLIHDDLPCMDDDDERRGQPTCHKKYGEANAVLAGDGLLTYAFELMAAMPRHKESIRMTKELAHAAGTVGMIGGQVVDKLSENQDISLPLLDYINIHKTGKLITVSCLMGALAARASKAEEKMVVKYGELLGFAFQVVDDVLDGDGYCRFMSQHEAMKRGTDLIMQAKEAIAPFGSKGRVLRSIADMVLERGRVHTV